MFRLLFDTIASLAQTLGSLWTVPLTMFAMSVCQDFWKLSPTIFGISHQDLGFCQSMCNTCIHIVYTCQMVWHNFYSKTFIPTTLLFCAYHPCQPTLMHRIHRCFLNLGSQEPSAASQLMFLVLPWRRLNRCTLLPRLHPPGPNITYRHHCQLCTTSRCPSRPGLWALWAIPRPVSHILRWIHSGFW